MICFLVLYSRWLCEGAVVCFYRRVLKFVVEDGRSSSSFV